jgi:hypothetical protein
MDPSPQVLVDAFIKGYVDACWSPRITNVCVKILQSVAYPLSELLTHTLMYRSARMSVCVALCCWLPQYLSASQHSFRTVNTSHISLQRLHTLDPRRQPIHDLALELTPLVFSLSYYFFTAFVRYMFGEDGNDDSSQRIGTLLIDRINSVSEDVCVFLYISYQNHCHIACSATFFLW